MLNIWDFQIVFQILFAIAGLAVAFVSARFVIRKISAYLMEKQKTKTPKLSKKKGFVKNKSFENRLHSIENYQEIYSKHGKYRKLKNLEEKQINEVAKTKFNKKDEVKQKLITTLKKLSHKTKIAPESEVFEPDLVGTTYNKKGIEIPDKRTYIQIFDNDFAEKFANAVNSLPNGSNEFPYVCSVKFNSQSNLKPLIVSTPNENAYKAGIYLMLEKSFEIAEENSMVFPLTVLQQHKSFDCVKKETIQNAEELENIINNLIDEEKTTAERQI